MLMLLPALMAGGAALGRHAVPETAPSLPEGPEATACDCAPRRVQHLQGKETLTGRAADAAFLEALGLLEGHLMIGRALVEGGEGRLGQPLFGHPVRELYAWLEPHLAGRRVAPFGAALTRLDQVAREGASGAALTAAYLPAQSALAAARASVAMDEAFRLAHIATMVEAVAAEYGGSIDRGRIVNLLEYHESAGFLRYAMAQAAQGQGRVWRSVQAELMAIRDTAYPGLLPPSSPPVSITALRRRADSVRALAAQVVS
ncbi:hypothetical protein NON00_05050 [Roseomonas sp. GC11]|uniref:hypothetical protein n=1 Tax=Roseomonas sp. GC11 TaxID=2950546 RepID=UPI002108AB4E|nr:hypothetical protein [Roseomonas sp. GC11]MCQ4159290.1 hypothetical protein [Roseomonas sp. GC11]